MSTIQYVSQATLDKMKGDLNELKTTGRANVAQAIAEAREKGDLKENAEYDAAKEAQGHNEAKIALLEETIANSRVITKDDIDTSRVSILTKVQITNIKVHKTFHYQLVSDTEANIKEGKLSVSSPIAKGILGKKEGETADIETPNGIVSIRIDKISI